MSTYTRGVDVCMHHDRYLFDLFDLPLGQSFLGLIDLNLGAFDILWHLLRNITLGRILALLESFAM